MPVPLRSDFDAVQLRVIARKAKEGPQARRLLALAAVYEGATRIEAAKIGGVTRAACRAFARSSRLASVRQAWRAREHHTRSAASQCPELNPMENIWQFIRDNWISDRIFNSYEAILDHCCFAWNKLIDMPSKIMSIGIRDWAYRF
jgi:hypothetical protein